MSFVYHITSSTVAHNDHLTTSTMHTDHNCSHHLKTMRKGPNDASCIGPTTSADHPQVGHRYLPKNTCRSCTCESGSHYSHRSRRIQVTILEFCRYLQVPVDHPMLSNVLI